MSKTVPFLPSSKVPSEYPSSAIEHALFYAALNWHVFPVWGCDEDGKCRCGSPDCRNPGKHPVSRLVPRGHLDATVEEKTIRQWWAAFPNAGVAVNMAASGLVGIDIDPRNGGDDTIEALKEQHGDFTSNVVQMSHSGGEHWIYFAPTGGARLPAKLGPGVDVKYNGYLVVAPTRGEKGSYEWEGAFDPLDGSVPSPLPEWILDYSPDSVRGEAHVGAVRHVDSRTLEELKDALAHLDADDYHTWVETGMALSTIGAGGFALWDEWSATSPKYKPGEMWRKWRSFRNDKSNNLNIESIFYRARNNGWTGRPAVSILETELPAAPPVKEPGTPEHLLTIPGALGEAVDWINDTARKPQPQFAVQAALAFGAAIAGRRYVTSNDNWPALYFLNIAKSASGKEHAKWALETLLDATGASEIIGPNGYKSDSAVISALLHRPNHVTVIDEFGRYLKAAANRNHAHQANALTMLMEVWGRAGGTIRPPALSTFGLKSEDAHQLLEERTVRNPSLSLLAMTTPETFYQSVGSGALTDGFLNRFLIVESAIGRQPGRLIAPKQPPTSIIEWAKSVRRQPHEWGIVNPDESPMAVTPVRVSFSDEAFALFTQFERECVQLMDAHESAGLAEMFGRTNEIAMRLSLIVALSNGEAEISEEAARWAIDYARYYATRAAANLEAHVADSEFGAVMKKVYAQIQKGGSKGRTVRELARTIRAFAEMTVRQREEILRALESTEDIVQIEIKPLSGRGQKRIAWVAAEFVPEGVQA